MTELTRLFDMMRGEERADFWVRVERDGWHARVSLVNDGWRMFFTVQPTPEACIADLVVQLAEWQSKREGGAG